jgi:hypothetical protein
MDKELLTRLEADLESVYSQKNVGIYTMDLEQHCKQMEAERNKILLVEEENWR